MAAVGALVVFKPRSAGLTLMLNEIDPQRAMMYWCSVDTGWVTEFWPKRESLYWHGLVPVVELDIAKVPWKATPIMTNEKISDRFTK